MRAVRALVTATENYVYSIVAELYSAAAVEVLKAQRATDDAARGLVEAALRDLPTFEED